MMERVLMDMVTDVNDEIASCLVKQAAAEMIASKVSAKVQDNMRRLYCMALAILYYM